MRKTKFVNNEYYHIYNRGVDKRKIFSGCFDYGRFILGMKLLNSEDNGLISKWKKLQRKGIDKVQLSKKLDFETKNNLIDIICYCLNPNHYHFIIKQNKEKGVEKFMHKLSTSYTKYFNNKNNRSGSLFQGKFKSIHIDSNEYLLYLGAYVNCNNFIHGYSKNVNDWKYSSYLDYINKRRGVLCDKDIILNQFKNNKKAYKKFCDMNMNYLKTKKEFQRYLME